ncbi:MAG: acyltransferase [Actinobacteria bacterium]|nr:acyltransferase [Actinomycetota bacterium]
MHSEPTSRRRTGFRADVQALRALAVLSVVVYHLVPARLPGGYVGVDVFFVISGFLITSHLFREVSTTGRLSLSRFWARRIRRLLPASLTVLLFCAVACAIWIPDSLRQETLREIGASALYVQNWVLAANQVDYLGADFKATLVQHFWSLSLEEQFYLVWPLIILVLAFAVRRRGERSKRIALVSGLSVVFVASLVTSVSWTAHERAAAYFVTPTRAWEFALGGLVALGVPVWHRWASGAVVARTLLSWTGVAAIVATAFLFTGATPFPGVAALVPTLGAAAIIIAAQPRAVWSPMLVGRLRPVQFLGDVSYSLYLWHWPLIILYPLVIGHAPGRLGLLGLLLLSILLAFASKKFVEDPVLAAKGFARRRWPTYALGAAAMAIVLTVSGTQYLQIQERVQAQADKVLAQASGPCFGAHALERASGCADLTGGDVTIDTAFAAHDYADTSLGNCGSGTQVESIDATPVCSFGNKGSVKTVVVIGDSHAGHWLPALQTIAAQRDWHIVSYLRSSCPFTTAPISANGSADSGCIDWQRTALTHIEALHPSLAFVASLRPFGYQFSGLQTPSDADAERGYAANLRSLTAAGIPVVVARDTPYMEINIPNCLSDSRGGSSECDRPRSQVLDDLTDPLFAAAQKAPGVGTVDLTANFCNAKTCFAVIGGVAVYRDHHHMTASYSRSLAPALTAALQKSGVAFP